MTPSNKPVGIGIIGMGFMGRTHTRAYLNAIDDGAVASLIAVCDPDPDRRAGVASDAGNIGTEDQPERLFDPDQISGYEHADHLLDDDRVDLVSVCTPTDSHVDLAVRALEAGKHVLVEKPVATNTSDIERLIDAADRSGRLCVPAMCMRHWPGWRELRPIIDIGEHGPVRHARFERLGSMPEWGRAFYRDTARSGGAIFDLHVHDADFVLWLFGRPDAVSSIGDEMHISSQYRFRARPGVETAGGWLADPSFPFAMRYIIEFERAVLTFDINADPPWTMHAGGEMTHPEVRSGTGYDHQASAVIAAANGDSPELPTLHEALDVTRLIHAERQSASEGRTISIDGHQATQGTEP
ncbi:MAG: Gfo/Idh/MocA family oxidoreductase [Planctomycetota bacterium]